MAGNITKFQIAIDGPAGTTFPSFPSTDLAGGQPSEITLSNIRNKCNISDKLHFTADGRTRLGDQTVLRYYMELTEEGNTILNTILKANPVSAPIMDTVPKSHTAPPPDSAPAVTGAPSSDSTPAAAGAEGPATGPGVQTFTVKLLADTPAEAAAVHELPETHAAMEKLIDQVEKAGFLERGKLPGFTKTTLAALKAKYAAKASSVEYKEPSELTEQHWDAVLKNNRALHGYYLDLDKNILVKAPKQAFRLRGIPTPGTPANTPKADKSNDLAPETLANKPKAEAPKYNPPIPPFYVYDAASVNVTEIKKGTIHSLIEEGFDTLSVSGNLGGGKQIPFTMSAAFEETYNRTKQAMKEEEIDFLAVTYNFPRVVVDLDTDSLELTPECRTEAIRVSSIDDAKHFYRKYGKIFVTSFTLGGFLYSTTHTIKEEGKTLDQTKDVTRKAAGLSVQTPDVAASAAFAYAKGTGSEVGQATLNQQARLTWDAHGGNTLLATNPNEWVSTVKDHRLWRLMNQQRVVQLAGLIKDLDGKAYDALDNPSLNTDAGKDPIRDQEFNNRIRVLLGDAISKGTKDNTYVKRMEEYYWNKQYYQPPAWNDYHKFLAENYPDSHAAKIPQGQKFGGLNLNQKIYFGLFMASNGSLRFN